MHGWPRRRWRAPLFFFRRYDKAVLFKHWRPRLRDGSRRPQRPCCSKRAEWPADDGASAQPAHAFEPACGPLDDPVHPAHYGAVLLTAAGDLRADTRPAQNDSRSLTVVSTVSIQCVRTPHWQGRVLHRGLSARMATMAHCASWEVRRSPCRCIRRLGGLLLGNKTQPTNKIVWARVTPTQHARSPALCSLERPAPYWSTSGAGTAGGKTRTGLA